MTITAPEVGSRQHLLEREIDAAGWGLLLMWIAVSMVADVGWGIALLGIGGVILLAQAVRVSLRLAAERFSLAVGVLFVAAGAWELLGPSIGLVPVICFAGGLMLLGSAVRAYLRDRRGAPSR
jgi:hypothetical protein